MKTKSYISKNIFQSVLFTLLLFLYSSCSNSPTTYTGEAKQENKNPEIAKQDTLLPPQVTVLKNLADSSKPKQFFLEKVPISHPITIPPSNIPLAVLKNKKGEAIKDNDGNPFILGEAGGLSNFINYTTDQGLALDGITCSLRDKIGNLWFGTDGGGVSRYDGKSFTNFTIAQGLAKNNLACIAEDKMGNLWFGTEGGGVSRYDGNSFTSFNTNQGLAHNNVLSIAEDKMGNLWFGTDGGGVSFYNPSDTKLGTGTKSFTNFTIAQGLANNIVMSIWQDKIGNIWFGTYGGGVSRYDGKRANHPCNKNTCKHDLKVRKDYEEHSKELAKSFTNFTTSQGLADNKVLSVVEDKAGNLWFGTQFGGVSRYEGNRSNHPCNKNICTHDLRIQQDSKEHNKELAKSFTNFTKLQGLAHYNVRTITEDKNGNLWFGTYGGGASRYDGKSFTNFTTAQGLATNFVRSITEDKTGNLWFGTFVGGVSRYDGKSFTNYTTTQGLANNVVWGIREDKSGNLWFGTYDGGVSRYDGKSFTNFTTAQGLAHNIVWGITEDKIGNLWFATQLGGVSCYDGKSFTNYTTAQGLANNNVVNITEDKMGNLWFGTTGGGVSCYDGNRVEAINASLQRGEIIPEITFKGLKKINGKFVKSFTNYNTTQGLVNNTIRSAMLDKTGNLWFGTNTGVSRYDGKSFTNFTSKQGLPNSAVWAITEDKTGNLWFGNDVGGLSRYDGKSFLNFTTEQGLPDNTVTQVVITKEQNIAIGTNIGVGVLIGFSPLHLPKGAEHAILLPQNNLSNEELKNYTPVIELYNSAMGYPVKDVNIGQNGMFEDSNGIIWIATGSNKTALVRFDYAALNKNKMPLDVFIQSVKINNSTICWYDLEGAKLEQTDSTTTPSNITEEVTTLGKVLSDAERNSMKQKFSNIKFDGITKFYPIPENLVLPYANNNITFDYAAIEPAKPYLVRYQYILEGYDNSWNPITNATTATFGNIYEGTYTFKLKAQSPFGVWSEPIEYTFRVLPPWYRHWLAYLCYLLALVSCIFLIIWWNGRRLRAKAIELTEEVRKATVVIREEKEKVELANVEISEQKKIVEAQNFQIVESINYSKKIQDSLLPSLGSMRKAIPDLFVLYMPKDIVSGDFYYFCEFEKYTLLACVDCTGHGVPGGFMSTLGSLLLDKIVNSTLLSPSEILHKLSDEIIRVLHQQDGGEIQEGMDLSICLIDRINKKIEFSGARNGIIIVTDGQAKRYKADMLPVGGNYMKKGIPVVRNFKTQTILINQNDWIYMYTDGFMEQMGGEEGIPMNYNQFEGKLIDVSKKQNSDEKIKLLETEIDNWRGKHERDDDILIIGFQVT